MAYATLTEFLRVLQVASPTPEQSTAAQRCLDAATQEIDAYLSQGTASPPFAGDQLALVTQVNLDRAAEHWRLTPYGTLPQGPEMGPVITARNSWYRHARNLDSLKTDWGVG
jgi:hypothetical protein